MNDTEKVYAILIMLGLWGVVTFFMMIAWVFSEIERFKMMKRRWEAQDAFWEAQTAMWEKRLVKTKNTPGPDEPEPGRTGKDS